VGKWITPKSDEDILIMVFNGMIGEFACPVCNIEHSCLPSDELITCDCGEIFYSPLYDPSMGL
jgi:hypothetical protein